MEDARLKDDSYEAGVVRRFAEGFGVEGVDFLPGVLGSVADAIDILGFGMGATLKPKPFLPRTFSTR
jgi:hypothetical protein